MTTQGLNCITCHSLYTLIFGEKPSRHKQLGELQYSQCKSFSAPKVTGAIEKKTTPHIGTILGTARLCPATWSSPSRRNVLPFHMSSESQLERSTVRFSSGGNAAVTHRALTQLSTNKQSRWLSKKQGHRDTITHYALKKTEDVCKYVMQALRVVKTSCFSSDLSVF